MNRRETEKKMLRNQGEIKRKLTMTNRWELEWQEDATKARNNQQKYNDDEQTRVRNDKQMLQNQGEIKRKLTFMNRRELDWPKDATKLRRNQQKINNYE